VAITSVGYDGILDEVSWARAQAGVGHAPFGVDGNSLDLTVPASSVPQVALDPGTFFGWGVYDTSDVKTTLTVSTPPTTAGQVRWDTLVARRNWAGTGGTTTFAWVTGNATKAVASSINKNPGVLADQPLYLVQTTGGSAVATGSEDLRTFNPPPIWYLGSNPNNLDPNLFRYGQTLLMANYGHTLVRRGRSDITPSTASWYNLDDPPWTALDIGSGMVSGPYRPEYRVRRGEVEVQGVGRRVPTTNGGIWEATTANVELTLGVLPATHAPAVQHTWAAGVEGGMGGYARCFVPPDGLIHVTLLAGQQMSGIYYDCIRYPVKVTY